MQNILEAAAFVVVVVVLAAAVLVCIMSASVLAVDRASMIDSVGAYGSDDDLSSDGWCFGPMASSAPCP